MSHELVIRGGHVVDGLGSEPVPADVAIDDGTITAVGKVDAKGRREIAAEGLARVRNSVCGPPLAEP